MVNKNAAGGGHDDSDLRKESPTPSQSGSGGGTLATDIGSEDEEKTALDGDLEPTARPKGTRSSQETGRVRTMRAHPADERHVRCLSLAGSSIERN
jgi:hypothetical protein